jgi:hypothetical protein
VSGAIGLDVIKMLHIVQLKVLGSSYYTFGIKDTRIDTESDLVDWLRHLHLTPIRITSSVQKHVSTVYQLQGN